MYRNEFHVSNCPGLRGVEKYPSKGPIRPQLSYVLKNRNSNSGICKLQKYLVIYIVP